MRIWDLPPSKLCRNHLLGEHRELHALWTVLTENKKGYSRHPETIRWKGKLNALYKRHEMLVDELSERGYSHKSPLDAGLATGNALQTDYVNTIGEQKILLKKKGCSCFS